MFSIIMCIKTELCKRNCTPGTTRYILFYFDFLYFPSNNTFILLASYFMKPAFELIFAHLLFVKRKKTPADLTSMTHLYCWL